MLNNCALGFATLSISPKISQTFFNARHRHRRGRPRALVPASQGSSNRTPSSAAAAASAAKYFSHEAAKQLTNRIKSANTPAALFATLKAQQDIASVRHLSIALHHLSKLQPPSIRNKKTQFKNHLDIIWLVDEIMERDEEIWEDISIANVLEAYHILRLGTDFPELLAKAEMELTKPRQKPSNWRTVTSLLTALAKLGRKMDTHPYLQAVQESLLSTAKTIPSSTAKKINNNEDDAQRLNLKIKLEDFDDYWGLAWALTELECAPYLADTVVSHVSTRIGFKYLSPRQLLFITRLAAERGSPHRALPTAQDVATALTTGRWEAALKSPTPRVSARDLAMLFFSLAKLVRMAASTDLNSEIDPAMWHKMEQRVTQIDGSTPDLQCAIRLLQRALAPLVPIMEAHEISSVASALSQMQRTKSALVPMLAARATELAPSMDSMGLCMIARALASLQFDSEPFIETAAMTLRQHLLNSASKGNAKRKQHQHASLSSQQQTPSIQGLIAMLYSLAVLDRCDGPAVQKLLSELIPRLIPSLPELDPVENNYLPLVGWSLMVAKGVHQSRNTQSSIDNNNKAKDSILQALKAWRSAITVVGHRIPPRQLAMVQHVDVALRIECPDLGTDAPAQYDAFFNSLYDSGRLRFRAGAEWAAQKDRVLDSRTSSTIGSSNELMSSTSSSSSDSDTGVITDTDNEDNTSNNNRFGYQKNGSRFQREVYSALCQAIIPPGSQFEDPSTTTWEFEYWERNLWYPVDAALPAYKLAIEADGPTHYATNTLRPLGHTLLKRRLLKQLGWTVVNIPLFEWVDVAALGDTEARNAYLVRKVEEELEGNMKIEDFLKTSVVVAPVAEVEIEENKEVAAENVIAEQVEEHVYEEIIDDKAVGNRALRLDLIKMRQGKLSKSQLAFKAAMRNSSSSSSSSKGFSSIKKKKEQ